MGTIHTALPKIALSALLAIGTMPMSALAAPDSSASSRQPSATAQARTQTSLSEARADLVAAEAAKADADADAAAAAAAVSSAQCAYDAAAAALKAAEDELAKYQEKAKLGSLGFFQEVGSTYAAFLLQDPEGTSGLGNMANTSVGSEGDATSLDNMKKAIERMSKIDDLRESEGLAPLSVTDTLMAISQIQANYAVKYRNHAGNAQDSEGNYLCKFKVGENLAWGASDPFIYWFDKEKANYEKDMTDGILDGKDANGNKVGQTGHYLNIVDADNIYCGAAGVYDKGNRTDEQCFDGGYYNGKYGPNPGETSYSFGDYYKRFMDYYNKVKGNVDRSFYDDLNKAKAALDAAKQAQGAADETAAEAAQEQRHAQEAVDEAQATVDAANASTTIVTRTAGNEAEQTAVAIAQQVRPNRSGSIVIARSDDFADSMSATGLAGLLGAPILLIDRFEGANAETLAEIARLNPIQAYVIGGPGAIPAMDELNDQLRNAGVKRIENIYGEDAADTSAKCGARICEIDDTIGNGTPEYTVVAMSDNFQDALSMSSFAYKYHAPVILLTSAPDARGRRLTAESAELLSSGALCDSKIFVAGGEGAVSNDSLSREGLQAFKRLAGESGYDTSNQIACYMLENGLLSSDTVTLACGAEEARGLDALAGAALAGKNCGPILLVNAQQAFGDNSLQTIKGADSERTAAFLDSHADAVYWVDVLGGEYVMPESLIETVRTIIR